MAKITSLGATITVAGTNVGGLNSISIPESDAADIDLTTLESTAKEYAGGLSDFGTVTLSGKFNISDTGQSYLRNPANQGGTAVACVVTFSDDSTATFDAVVKGFGTEIGDTDTAVDFTASLRISGDVVYAA